MSGIDLSTGIVQGLVALSRDNPWPELKEFPPFYLSLDGGGREIVFDAIKRIPRCVMVEIGCFLGGSTRQWLDTVPDLTVIGVDPWDGNWARYVNEMAQNKRNSIPNSEQIIEILLEHGNYSAALNNLRAYRDRFIPVRRMSPEALHYLKHRGITPNLIFIDAFKEAIDLETAHDLFPKAVLCGDDWDWKDRNGILKMQENVTRFAKERGFEIEADRATWILR